MQIEQSHVDRALRIAGWYSRTAARRAHLSDLDSAALEGLARAANGWDGHSEFWKYAFQRILGSMKDELRRFDHLTRDLRKAVDEDQRVEGLAYIDGTEPRPLDTGSVDGDPFIETVVEPRDRVHAFELRDALDRALALLPERERFVLLAMEYKGYRNQEVAAELGVSFARVSQLRARAFNTVRAVLAESLVDAA